MKEIQRYLLARLIIPIGLIIYTFFKEEKEMYLAFAIGYLVCWIFSFIGTFVFSEESE